MWKVLIVEDEPVSQKLMVKMLKGKASCDVAVTGREALEVYRRSIEEKKPYDLALLDLLIPETNHGMEVLQNIRRDEAGRKVKKSGQLPVIVVTAYKYAEKNAFDCGCNDFIHKPVESKELFQKMKALLKKKNTPV